MPADPARIVAADRRHVFRPFTPTEEHEAEPPDVIVGGEGPYVLLADGRRLFDASGAWWCNHLGFQHPRLVAALRDQAAILTHAAMASMTHEQAALLAEELVAVAPGGLTRVFYGDNGSTAVEIAAKLALQYWQQNGRPNRRRFLTLGGGYHGDTVGAMSLGGVDAFHRVFDPLLFEVGRADTSAGHDAAFAWLERELATRGEDVAAVVIEPVVQGASGMVFYDPSLLAGLRAAADRADTFLLFDEVFTGYGRTGPMFASEHAGVQPDLLCTAKGLTGGVLPFSAVLTTDRIHAGFGGGRARAFLHGHTFFGNPLGARVAREVLAVYRDEDVLGQGRRTAAVLAKGVAHLARHPFVRSARSLGCIAAFELGDGGYLGTFGWRLRGAALERGVALRPLGNTIYLVPPLVTAPSALEQAFDRLDDALVSIFANGRNDT